MPLGESRHHISRCPRRYHEDQENKPALLIKLLLRPHSQSTPPRPPHAVQTVARRKLTSSQTTERQLVVEMSKEYVTSFLPLFPTKHQIDLCRPGPGARCLTT